MTKAVQQCKIYAMDKLLLHSCCGPCSTVVIERLKSRFEVTVFYCNPNVEPLEEYEKRKAEQKKVCQSFGISFVDADYENSNWRKAVAGHETEKEGGKRCQECFLFRLKRTAKYAKENGFDIFASTLSVSPHKNTEMVNFAGEIASKEENIEFLSESFKKKDGYLRSIQLAKDLNLYRQNYCGCLFGKAVMEAEMEAKKQQTTSTKLRSEKVEKV